MQVEAQPQKARRTQIYTTLPEGYQQLDDSKMYYNIGNRWFAGVTRLFSSDGPGYQYAISILGEIDDSYYASTYGDDERDDGCGSGFLAALKVGNNNAVYVNSLNGTTDHGVRMTARLEAAGEVAARVIYTLTNNNNQAVTVSAGVYGDVMIGINDFAPLERLIHEGDTYGMKMKESNVENAPLFCALFGEGVTGVTPADDYWFGEYNHNFNPGQIVGDYSNIVIDHWLLPDDIDPNYMVENGSYDSALGFCWKNRTIPAGESIELSYLISIGEIEYEEPFVPGDDRFEYTVEAFDFEGWNDLSQAHPAHVFGYYEHPYGQTGYIEYQVDDENTWHRIPTALVSGQEFDLPFDMFFNEGRATNHVLALRFNDGLDNITPMDGLTWIDVRSIPISGLEDRNYTGQPQTYEVTIGDGDPFTIGENGEYVNPGTYSFGFEGEFDNNTIGVNEVEFSIIAGETVVNVTIPEDCVYDGEPHAATAVVVVGDGEAVITYVNTETGETLTEAPVEPGTYEVFVEVINSVNFNDLPNTSYGTFTIGLAETVIDVTIPEDCVYDGEAHAATALVVVGDGEAVITYVNTETGETLTEAPVEPGTYEVFVEVINSVNYNNIENTSYGTFTIDKKQSVIEYTIPDDCVRDGKQHAATVILVEGDGELTVVYVDVESGVASTEAPSDPGTYAVVVTVTETDHYYGIDETEIGRFTIHSYPTSVEEINADSEDNGIWYTIDGRRVSAPNERGIYIRNGKKYYKQ